MLIASEVFAEGCGAFEGVGVEPLDWARVGRAGELKERGQEGGCGEVLVIRNGRWEERFVIELFALGEEMLLVLIPGPVAAPVFKADGRKQEDERTEDEEQDEAGPPDAHDERNGAGVRERAGWIV